MLARINGASFMKPLRSTARAMRAAILPTLVFTTLITGPARIRASAQTPPAAAGASSTPFWTGITDAASFQRAMDARIAHAREALAALGAHKGARTIDNTLR